MRARIISSATASPPLCKSQDELRCQVSELLLGPGWEERPEIADQVLRVTRLFEASGVHQRQVVVDAMSYYDRPRSTGQRMADYQRYAYPLARSALQACLNASEGGGVETVTDFIVVSCTGYSAPGLDIVLARDLGLSHEVRRVFIGHMGCAGGIVGLRDALATLRGRERPVVALLSIELSSLHGQKTLDLGVLTAFALFGDAAAAVLLSSDPAARGPEVVDTYCVSDFSAMDQMSWTVGDEGFVMGLSIRVPVTLRRNIGAAVERLLAPHALTTADVTHWLVHPGGPSILEAIQHTLCLSDEQMALSWEILHDHGNCSSTTILLMLDRLLRFGRTQRGEWGVMMAFGPGLTLETCLLRF